MAASDFFARWGKVGTAPRTPAGPAEAVGTAGTARNTGHDPALTQPRYPAPVGKPAPRTRLPNLEDALALRPGSNFVPFMARGVDESVKRLALKQLFADPHFNVMDGLDTYIGDYNTFVPMSAAMVAALNHGKALLDPLAHLLSSTQGGSEAMAPTLAIPEGSASATGAAHTQREPTAPDSSTAPAALASAADNHAPVPVSFISGALPANPDANDLPDL